MRATVNYNTCNGCGFCARMVEEIFIIDGNGKAFALDKDIPLDSVELAQVAAEECPRQSIELSSNKVLIF